jgi:hypothetical protein
MLGITAKSKRKGERKWKKGGKNEKMGSIKAKRARQELKKRRVAIGGKLSPLWRGRGN